MPQSLEGQGLQESNGRHSWNKSYDEKNKGEGKEEKEQASGTAEVREGGKAEVWAWMRERKQTERNWDPAGQRQTARKGKGRSGGQKAHSEPWTSENMAETECLVSRREFPWMWICQIAVRGSCLIKMLQCTKSWIRDLLSHPPPKKNLSAHIEVLSETRFCVMSSSATCFP